MLIPDGCLLEPHSSAVVDGEQKVFATSSKEFALQYTGRKWSNKDFEAGSLEDTADGCIMNFLIEKKPGIFKKTFAGAKGYLYIVDPRTFHSDERLSKQEMISDVPVKIVEKILIPDSHKAILESKLVVIPYEDLNLIEFVTADRRPNTVDLSAQPLNEYHLQTLIALNQPSLRVKVSTIDYERVNKFLYGVSGIASPLYKLGYTFHREIPYYVVWRQ